MSEFLIARVTSVSTTGVAIRPEDSGAALTKQYSFIVGQTLKANDRVLAVEVSGTYVVLGKLSK